MTWLKIRKRVDKQNSKRQSITRTIHVPLSNVLFDTVRVSFQRNSTSQKDKQQDNGQAHGKVGNASGPLGSARQACPNQEPRQGAVAHVDSHDTRGTTRFLECVHTNDIVQKVVNGDGSIGSFFSPRGVVSKAVKESVNDPSDQYTVVGHLSRNNRRTGRVVSYHLKHEKRYVPPCRHLNNIIATKRLWLVTKDNRNNSS